MYELNQNSWKYQTWILIASVFTVIPLIFIKDVKCNYTGSDIAAEAYCNDFAFNIWHIVILAIPIGMYRSLT